MEELYSIMRDLLEVEYNQKSLLWILEVLEATYSGEKEEEIKFITNSTKYYLEALQTELRNAISRIDGYIVAAAKDK